MQILILKFWLTVINMLICRIKTSKHLSLIELLEQIQADCIAGISHEHFSLTELFHDMKLSDDGLFNTTMSFPPEISQMQSNRPTIEFQQITRHGPTEVSNMKYWLFIC